ncbi:hypothetical protein [Synechococcus elongatus]|uniref:30S ribosomal protein S21 n=1 Tax=Synechococcus elongatus PCC 11802 TaxID=2283154 RepID=A0AAT9JZC8_SYNEL|nr:hypothetical protein [Synechococcus elongatus]
MAKRRNLKKEKALRNEAYARKFRKRNLRSRGRRPSPFANSQNNEEKGTETTEAA